MSPISRRTLLRTGLVSAGVALAGCSESSGGSSPTPDSATGTPTETPTPEPFETPAPDGCAALERPQPTPVAGYEPKSYPEYPESIDSGRAEAFASLFEEAYRYNEFLEETGEKIESIDINTVAQPNRTERVGAGYLVSAEGTFSTGVREDGRTVIADDYLFAVYYAGPDVALRRGYEGTPRDADSLRWLAEDGTPVVCRY